MRLLIISATPHYWRAGQIVGWGPTIREIDALGSLFQTVTHIAPLYDVAAPASAMAYEAVNIQLHPVMPSGGERWRDKIGILRRWPHYARTMIREFRRADVAHVRAPANISLLALLLLAGWRRPALRWAKYAGDWSGPPAEPSSYAFQRWWLMRGFHRGIVTVNGRWPGQPMHIHSLVNPCLTADELAEGNQQSRQKQLSSPVRLLFIGRLEACKGVGICLEILSQLLRSGVAARLDLIGEGRERGEREQQAQHLGVATAAQFHGGLPRPVLAAFYSQAHFILLPTACSEGWPKVLSEAMAYGVVPIASAISSIPQILGDCGAGKAISSLDPRCFSRTIEAYLAEPLRWQNESRSAVQAAPRFSYARYLQVLHAGLRLPTPGIGVAMDQSYGSQ